MTATPPTDTTAALEAAILAAEAIEHDILAHVDAEVTRRLACAPGVEEAIFKPVAGWRDTDGDSGNFSVLGFDADGNRTGLLTAHARYSTGLDDWAWEVSTPGCGHYHGRADRKIAAQLAAEDSLRAIAAEILRAVGA